MHSHFTSAPRLLIKSSRGLANFGEKGTVAPEGTIKYRVLTHLRCVLFVLKCYFKFWITSRVSDVALKIKLSAETKTKPRLKVSLLLQPT